MPDARLPYLAHTVSAWRLVIYTGNQSAQGAGNSIERDMITADSLVDISPYSRLHRLRR